MSKPSPNVLIVCKDLLISSQINGIVQRVGLVPQTCLGITTAIEALSSHSIRWVILDLELKPLDLPALRTAAINGCQLLAFGPHVHEDLLRTAQQIGCDLVLTRGQAIGQLDQILRSAGTADSPPPPQ